MKIKLDENETTSKEQKNLNCECIVCGKKFHLKPCAVKRYKTHCCSKECLNKARSERMKGNKNHQYGLKGKLNPTWKSDSKMNKYGYIKIRIPEHPFADSDGFVLEHRLIAEQNLLDESNSVEIDGKMYLNPDFVVHHKNFNRTDNRPENLIIMKRGDHTKLHNALTEHQRDEFGHYIPEEPQLIKVKRIADTAIIPERKSIGAAGYDLCVDISEPVTIKPNETIILPTNLAFEIPANYFGAIYARSGLATKEGLRPATCVSVIDSDYRGAVGIPIHNDSNEIRMINPKERVAQIVFQKALIGEFEEVDTMSETERSDNGFGSSGK